MRQATILWLFVYAITAIAAPARPKDRKAQLRYMPVSLCDIVGSHPRVKVGTHISVKAYYESAIPHGLFLSDPHCPKILLLDWANTGLDPSVALIETHMFEIHRASGTFRGMLKRYRNSGRKLLWLESVKDFHSDDYIPDLNPNQLIQLPEPPLPKSPPGS